MASQDGRRSSASRGYGHHWRKESKSFLALNPWCSMRGPGCELLAVLVDHITPHRGDMTLFWNRKNWQGLCNHCHSSHKQRIEARTATRERDHRGRLLLD